MNLPQQSYAALTRNSRNLANLSHDQIYNPNITASVARKRNNRHGHAARRWYLFVKQVRAGNIVVINVEHFMRDVICEGTTQKSSLCPAPREMQSFGNDASILEFHRGAHNFLSRTGLYSSLRISQVMAMAKLISKLAT